MDSLTINRYEIANNCFARSSASRNINFLILHHLQANSIDETIEALEKYEVSAHFLIDKNGKVAQLVEENDVAFHAGVSYWNGVDGINQHSIGIEFINSNPFTNNFSKQQMIAGIELISYLINKYQILPRYILGHSDIAYHRQSGLLDRKQDPSHLFDWQYLAQHNIGLYPYQNLNDEILLFEYGNISNEIVLIKQKLQKFGYKLSAINDNFDEEMRMLTRVFNRHFNNNIDLRSQDLWLHSSEYALNQLIDMIS